MNNSKLPPYQRTRSQIAITMSNNKINTCFDIPIGTVLLDHQVAGHTFQDGKDTIGMLKDEHDGSILKPANKPVCGEREIEFYDKLKFPKEPNMLALRQLIPDYRGTVKMKLGDRNIDFIKIGDITHDMSEPCVIDIKIGKRTWDPLASKEKIEAEEQKYRPCKENLGFCIPGFQVYSVKNGSLKRYGKDYGKKLTQHTIKDALKIFLNAESGMSRALIVQFLSGLWNIQKFARNQTNYKFYSSSILLAYDARCLRNSLQSINKANSLNGSPTTPLSGDTNGKFQWTVKPTETHQVYKKVQRSHSSKNNYDEDLKTIRETYAFMLCNLISDNDNKEWAFVKMIDFAHAFPSDDLLLDTNYLFGIESLVKYFESFLEECD